MPNQFLGRLSIVCCVCCLIAGCSKEPDSPKQPVAQNHDGQGEQVSTDPEFVLSIKIDDQPVNMPLHRLSIYESKPGQGGKPAAAQGFELEGDNVMLAGSLPKDLSVAPTQKFQMLIDQPLAVRRVGGEASFTKLSKITLSDQKVYRVEKGTLTPKKAFYHPGKYACISGDVELTIQQIKLGDSEDPNNKGDQPIGEPKPITGTFATPAAAYPYESM